VVFLLAAAVAVLVGALAAGAVALVAAVVEFLGRDAVFAPAGLNPGCVFDPEFC
jgi:hypothetical protein